MRRQRIVIVRAWQFWKSRHGGDRDSNRVLPGLDVYLQGIFVGHRKVPDGEEDTSSHMMGVNEKRGCLISKSGTLYRLVGPCAMDYSDCMKMAIPPEVAFRIIAEQEAARQREEARDTGGSIILGSPTLARKEVSKRLAILRSTQRGRNLLHRIAGLVAGILPRGHA